MSKSRRRFSAEDKASILRRHLSDGVPISDLAEEYGIQPSLLCQWQRQLLDNAAAALEPSRRAARTESKLKSKLEALESKLQQKDSVIAEISEEYVKLRKELGEL